MLKILIFFFLGISLSICQDNGLDAYNSGDMIKARNIYEKLYKKVPNSDAIKFGLGTTAFRQKDQNTAKDFLGSVKNSNDPILASKAFYNLGELFIGENDFNSGLLMYKKAIILNPNDTDAKINYELLKRKIQNQDQQNQDQQNQDQQNQDQQNQDEQNQDEQNQDEQNQDQQNQDQQNQDEQNQDQQNQDQQNQDQQNQDQQNQDQQNQDQQNQDQQNQDQQNQDQQNQDEQNQDEQNQDKKNRKMQAEAILNALQKKEKINQKLKISKSKTRSLVKDW